MVDNAAIVVDVGSGYIKAGLSTNDEPTCVFPSLVGKPRRRYVDQYPGSPRFTGEEAVEARQQLSLFYPVDHGHVDDWGLMDELWNHVFSANSGLNPESSPALVTQPPLTSDLHQRRVLETLFDVYSAQEVCLQVQAILSLFSTGRTTGITLEIGEGVTQVVPTIDGHPLREACQRIDCGGQEVTMYLQKLLCNNGYAFTTRDDFEYVRLIKESYCYVALDPAYEDLRTDLDTTFTLPDGFQLRDGTRTVTIGPEKFYCPEALFDPSLIDKDHAPLYDLVMQALGKAPIDTRTRILENIVLAGGSTLFKGLKERLTQDLCKVVQTSKQNSVSVTQADNGVYSAWHGGKLFAEMRDNHPAHWATLRDWHEFGESIIDRFRTI